jgi:HNH endonuclease
VNALYPLVAERAVYRCEYCHAPEIIFNFPFEVEHILPQARGGSDDLNNLALASMPATSSSRILRQVKTRNARLRLLCSIRVVTYGSSILA